MNTPQFEWVKSRLERRAQPVPPIFEPEVAADAIVWASRQSRREVFVGAPTTAAIVGNKIAPGLGDRYLARTGFDAQQTSEPERPDRPDNLWRPVDDIQDFGPHGRFGRQAKRSSWQLWMTEHRRAIAAASAAIAVLGAARLRPSA
jgi:hypothetical protein